MKKIELILLVIRSVNSFIMIASLLSNDYDTFYASYLLFCAVLIAQFISFIIRKIIVKKRIKSQQVSQVQIDAVTKRQIENFNMLESKINHLILLIDSNVSYYEAQREYLQINQMINAMSKVELKKSQRDVLMLILEKISGDLLKLELKR